MRRTKEQIVADRTRQWRSLGYSGWSGYTACSTCERVTVCHGRSRKRVKCEECYVKGTRFQ